LENWLQSMPDPARIVSTLDGPAWFERIDDEGPFLRLAFLETAGLTAKAVAAMTAVLDEQGEGTAGQVRPLRRRKDVVAAHFLLRRLLEDSLGRPRSTWTLGATELGRPIVLAPAAMSDVRLSLSHGDGLVAAAIARGCEVGVDVEKVSRHRDRLDISDRFFAADEAAYLRSLSPDTVLDHFTMLWTLKEAFVKAIGKGFWQPFRSFSIALSEPTRISFHDPALGDAAVWQFWQSSYRNFKLALAYAPDREAASDRAAGACE
jgi:4'-phosphopantetheinyl transferase